MTAFWFAPYFFRIVKPFFSAKRSSFSFESCFIASASCFIFCHWVNSFLASGILSSRLMTPSMVCNMADVEELCKLNKRRAKSYWFISGNAFFSGWLIYFSSALYNACSCSEISYSSVTRIRSGIFAYRFAWERSVLKQNLLTLSASSG